MKMNAFTLLHAAKKKSDDDGSPWLALLPVAATVITAMSKCAPMGSIAHDVADSLAFVRFLVVFAIVMLICFMAGRAVMRSLMPAVRQPQQRVPLHFTDIRPSFVAMPPSRSIERRNPPVDAAAISVLPGQTVMVTRQRDGTLTTHTVPDIAGTLARMKEGRKEGRKHVDAPDAPATESSPEDPEDPEDPKPESREPEPESKTEPNPESEPELDPEATASAPRRSMRRRKNVA